MSDDPDPSAFLFDKDKGTQETGPSFDTKKSCWVPDPKEGFISAEVLSTKGEMVTVKTVTGKVRSVTSKSVLYVAFRIIFYSV